MNTTVDSNDIIQDNENLMVLNINDSPMRRPLAQKIMQLWCSGIYTKKEIATILNTTTTTVNKYLRDKRVLEAIENYQRVETKLVDQNIKAMREKALQTINELMDSDDDKVRYQASKDVLDRTGHIATMKKEVTIQHKSFEEQLNEIINADYSIESE